MTGLQWLRLDKTNLADIPEELGKLMKLVSRFLTTKYSHSIGMNEPYLFYICLDNIIF